jgi:RNA polymerase sigma-70 factor (ECF subfamily)
MPWLRHCEGVRRPGEADEAAFRAFAAVQMSTLLRPAYYLAGDSDEAQDLVQTALVKMYLAWPRLGADVDRHLYVRKVMLNAFRANLRRGWRSREVLAWAEDTTPVDQDGRPEERDYQRRLLMTLPPQQRAVIVLRYLQDLSVRQTADCLQVSEGTVKSHTSDALKSLRALVARERTDR